jgi:DNA processing protein
MSTPFATNAMKINRITPEKADFLHRIPHIAKAPESLYYIGEIPDSQRRAVAIVGSRKPTAYGQAVARRLATVLAEKGVVIVSGLAYGIDGVAHRAALDAGGTAVAVLACGLDSIYPTSHSHMAKEIVAKGGAIISEYEPGTPPLQFRFLERNRIVSALSDAVVVIEAAMRSGTLSTVAHALEQGVTVYAVPGNITSEMSAGCNMLIRQGAIPLCDANELLDELAISPASVAPARIPLGSTAQETAILQLIGRGTSDGELLLAASGLDAGEFGGILTSLELSGLVRSLGGNHWALAA